MYSSCFHLNCSCDKEGKSVIKGRTKRNEKKMSQNIIGKKMGKRKNRKTRREKNKKTKIKKVAHVDGNNLSIKISQR